jgi:putative protease
VTHSDHKSADSIELMAPAGSWESLRAAIQGEADSIYFGAGNLQMRAKSAAFSIDAIPEVVKIAHDAGIKAYLTLNTVIYDDEFAEVDRILDACFKSGVDAVIAADPYVLEKAVQCGVPLHISTQANLANISAVRMYAAYSDVMVLARELSLDKIRSIVSEIEAKDIRGPNGNPVRIEVFAHGALCVAISGRCYMSLAQHNTSANRGDCYQMCRRRYKVTDAETDFAYEIDNQWVMSPKDLCTLPVLDKILDAGVRVLKIEGRGRSPEYVLTVVRAYKQAISTWAKQEWNAQFVDNAMTELSKVFNRGFWEGGYYLGEQLDPWTRSAGSRATQTKIYIGRVDKYYKKSQIAQIYLEAGAFRKGDRLLITGTTTGVVEFTADTFQVDDLPSESAPKKSLVTLPLEAVVRPKDKVYLVESSSERA